MNQNSNNQTKRLVSEKAGVVWLSVLVALFLTLLKIVVALLTHSMAILASAADSFMDFLMSGVNLFAIGKSEKPADRDHPYGHAKVESLAAIFQCFLMTLSVVYLLHEAIKRLITGSYLSHFGLGFSVMGVSIIVSILLVVRLRWISKKTNSTLIATEELHFSTDILTNVGVILALILSKLTGSVFWDLAISIAISVYIAYYVYKIGIRAVQELIDHEAPRELQTQIKQFIYDFNEKIVDVHDFRARLSGNQIFAEFHITIKDETDFAKAHELTEDLVRALKEKFSDLELYIHYDPAGIREERMPDLA